MKNLNIILALVAVLTFYFAWWHPLGGPDDTSGGAGESEFLVEGLDSTEEALGLARRIAGIRIMTWEPEFAEVREFAVRHEAKRWVIPSHYNYPADSGAKAGETAGKLLSVGRGRVVTEDLAQHAEFGVLDPEQADLEAEADDVGKRVILENAQGETALDLIVGNRVADQWGHRYLRLADSSSVFTAKFDIELDSEFVDWVERDLLKIERKDARALKMDYHTIDEARRVVVAGPTATFKRETAESEWISADTPEGKTVDQDQLKEVLRAMDAVRISGVRPFDKQDLASMQAHGFFESGDRTLYGNQGAEHIRTAEGLIYKLYFGELAVGQGLALSAGADETGVGEDEGAKTHRYMIVYVSYHPEHDAAIARLETDQGDAEDGEGTGAAADEDQDDQEDGSAAEREQRIEKMQQQVEELRKRFDRFVFVVEDSVVERLRPEIDGLFAEPPTEEEGEGDADTDAAE